MTNIALTQLNFIDNITAQRLD